MAKVANEYYLGKDGEAHGPFTGDEIEKMRLSGEIRAFTYLWEPQHKKWQVIDPMPPEPGRAEGKGEAPAGMGAHALCQGPDALVGGTLENVTDQGCDLVSADHSEAPQLVPESTVLLNVTDRSGKKGMNVRASLAKIIHREGQWIYRMRWARRPSF